MAMVKILVTHYSDALRYLECGWIMISTKDITLKTNGKSYKEATIGWDNLKGLNPTYPKGPVPNIFND